MDELKKLHSEQSKFGFPKGYGGEEIKGIDLILLDANTEGCICVFISNEGKLDPWRIAILGVCYRNLTIVLKNSDGHVKEYFKRLEKMAEIVLNKLIKDNSKKYQ